MNKCIKWLLCCLLASACSKEKEVVAPMEINVHGFLSIPLENRVSANPLRVQYFETDSGEHIAISNKFLPSIEYYRLDDTKKVKTILVPTDGPNRVSLFNGFTIFSRDSILIASIPPKIVRFNFEGEKLGEVPVVDEEFKVNYLGSTNEYPFIMGKDVVFGAQPFFNDFHSVKESELADHRHVYKVTYKEGKPNAEWLPISHPVDSWKKGKISPNFTWTDRYDSIIVSPVSDHRLWVISKSKGEVIGYQEAKSSFVNKFQYIKGRPQGDKGIIEAVETDFYNMIGYDQYRDVFYRFFYVGVEWEQLGFGYRELFSNPPRIGVMVLDADLNVMGEHVFPDHHVQNWNFFVGRKGLYVSTNNELRDDYDENVLRYEIIRFRGLDYEDE